MVLMQPGCYLQSMNNDPASMLAAHWLPSLVFLAGFLLTFPCPITPLPHQHQPRKTVLTLSLTAETSTGRPAGVLPT